MKEHPILFSGPMVRAILEGRKTQTRRVITPQPTPHPANEHFLAWVKNRYGADEMMVTDSLIEQCRHGSVRDRLWVRESLRWTDRLTYAADGTEVPNDQIPDDAKVAILTTAPSIFMPRWASRITLEITKVRVEQLRLLSEEDAVAEGAGAMGGAIIKAERFGGYMPAAVYQFAGGWDALNAKRGYSWNSNPWVWVIEFKRLTSAGRGDNDD
ncbi:MAG TPA: hypothetical protein VIX17_11720 [Pyrinomonadaceae bacterium]